MTELNNNYDELNFVSKNEENNKIFSNENINNKNLEINEIININNKNTKIKKEVKRKASLKLISSFVFLCSAIAVLPLGINIPVFTEIFNSSTTISSTTPTKTSTYNFESIIANENDINFTLIINNFDLKTNKYCLYLVEKENANYTFFSSISKSIKSSAEINITSDISLQSFTTYLSLSGQKKIKPNTDYAILLVKNGEIVKKEFVKTKNFVYIDIVNFKTATDKTNRYLDIQLIPNIAFNNFNGLYVELYNLTLNKKVEDYSILYKGYLETSWARIPVKITEPVYDYELRIYCSSDNPEKLKYSNTFTKDEINYYLIYIHDNIVKF